ncbi:MAG: hypothetical protein LBS44_03820 [Deltaproteobacteria bacterium]|jgi:hypothetical protein|nr:hypothetical protein [Deltaproteobacteria bacterium]
MLRSVDQIVEELRLKVPFKATTNLGDVILMVRENEAGLVEIMFSRILGLSPEIKHRQEWWHVDMVFLTIPLNYATLIVNADQLTGKEIFTINGRKVFLKAVDTESPIEDSLSETVAPAQAKTPKLNLTLVKPETSKPSDDGN